ncbi:hypothetical protein FOBRF1_007079 [Fusarium oxysporum]
MFFVYQDGSGNVTLSTRMGHGHDMPEYNHMSAVKLLKGNGVSNKTMTAKINVLPHWIIPEPLLGKWLIHAGWQIVAFAGMWVGFGVGKVAADRDGEWFSEPHVQLGTIICMLMILQPVLGWMHHRNYVKYQRRTLISHVHLWYGRALMIIGIINGGIGLQLAKASASLIIAYAVIDVVASLTYAAGAICKEIKLHKRNKEIEAFSESSNSALELI